MIPFFALCLLYNHKKVLYFINFLTIVSVFFVISSGWLQFTEVHIPFVLCLCYNNANKQHSELSSLKSIAFMAFKTCGYASDLTGVCTGNGHAFLIEKESYHEKTQPEGLDLYGALL